MAVLRSALWRRRTSYASVVLLGAALALGPGSASLAGGPASAVGPAFMAAASTPRPAADKDLTPQPALTFVARDSLTRALRDGRLSEPEYALQRARSLFHRAEVSARLGPVAEAGARDATLVLRDLALRMGDLSGTDRTMADRLLARPTDGAGDSEGFGYTTADVDSTCGPNICTHWARGTIDAPPLADSNADGTPDWVTTTAATFEDVWRTLVRDDGYRAPLSDAASPDSGGDAKLDVYLADVGEVGYYGYCTTDDPALSPRRDVSAYCVVDNDFASAQFGGSSPVSSLRATAAHEFFHAVQFAYDIAEDTWLMEGSAAWIEDEVYDGINDNLQYLYLSPLTRPEVPVDDGDRMTYGSWIFWRFLEEHFGGATREGDPTVIRDVWRRADAAAGAPDDYSLQAVRAVLAARGTSLPAVFSKFGAVNQVARRWYDEGVSYPRPLAATSTTLTRARRATGPRSVQLSHLTNRTVVFRPGASLRGAWRLRINVDLPALSRGSAARIALTSPTGSITWKSVKLDAQGDRALTVRFTRARVASVALTLTSASARFRCRQRTTFSCAGLPLDDGLGYRYSAKAIR